MRLSLRSKLKFTAIKNAEVIEYNHRLKEECDEIQKHLEKLCDEDKALKNEIEFLNKEKESTKTAIKDLKEQANQSAKIFEEQTMNLTKNNIEQSMEKIRQEYLSAEEDYRQQYQKIVAECVADLKKQLAEKEKDIEKNTGILNELIAKTNSAVDAAKRAEEIRTQADFYKLQLTDEDKQEIEMLRNVAPYLRDREPLNKVIWKCYYEKPYTDLIGRIVGTGIKTGIYKITNTQNEMCYVGQAVNISDRWKQHIKRGIGAEAPTRNKLYPAMLEIGVENFTFEIIEECDRTMLNEREDYWQEYFHAKDFGYSIK